MPRLKLTKNELRRQRENLKRYERYLPTLQLKKQQLRRELEQIRHDRRECEQEFTSAHEAFLDWSALWGMDNELGALVGIRRVDVRWDNIAGVDIPKFEAVQFRTEEYDLFSTPFWTERAIDGLKAAVDSRARLHVVREQERRIQREWQRTAQRVNLFEHVKIPETRENIKTITVALADQQTSAFGWALMMKRKREAAA